jgi:hypothetical protein
MSIVLSAKYATKGLTHTMDVVGEAKKQRS